MRIVILRRREEDIELSSCSYLEKAYKPVFVVTVVRFGFEIHIIYGRLLRLEAREKW